MQPPPGQSHKRAGWARSGHQPLAAMAPRCAASSPALASVLLTVLLGGEWGHTSVRLSLGVCSRHPTVP